jgi:hypothetical protein
MAHADYGRQLAKTLQVTRPAPENPQTVLLRKQPLLVDCCSANNAENKT